MKINTYDKKNPKDCFATEELLNYLLQSIGEQKDTQTKTQIANKAANLEIFPYTSPEGIHLGRLKEENVLWFYPGQKVVHSNSSYRILATNIMSKATFDRFKQAYGAEGLRLIKEYSDQDAFDQLIKLMSSQPEYNELWWRCAKSAYKLWDRIDPGAKYAIASKGIANTKIMIFDDGYCKDIYRKILIKDGILVDATECKDATEYWQGAKETERNEMLQFLRYLGVPHSFASADGKINKNILAVFEKLAISLKSQFPVNKKKNPGLYTRCELVDYIVFAVLVRELDAKQMHDLLWNQNYYFGLAVRNVLDDYMPVGINLFFGKLLVQEEDTPQDEEVDQYGEELEEDKYSITNDPYECFHISEQDYADEILDDIAIKFEDISKPKSDYTFGQYSVDELKFYKWIWNYTHNSSVCVNTCKFFSAESYRVDSIFALEVLREVTEKNYAYQFSGISFHLPLTPNQAFENQETINRCKNYPALNNQIRIYLTQPSSQYVVSEEDKKLILDMVEALDRRPINDNIFWKRIFTIPTSLTATDVYGKYVYMHRSNTSYFSGKDIIMSESEDIRSYYTAITHYIADFFEVKVNIPYEAEILQIRKNTQNEFLGFVKKFKQRMEYTQSAVKLEDISGVITELGDVRTYGEEKAIWNKMINKVERLFDETSTDIVEFADDTISFMAKAYHGRCQLCGGRTATGEQSSHSFRYRMVKEHESPSYANMLSNMLCLCPTCHGKLGHGYGRRDLNPIVNLAKEYVEYYETFDASGIDDESDSLIMELATMDYEDEHIKHPIVCENIYINGGDEEGNPQKIVFSWEHFIRIAFLYSAYLEEKLEGLEYIEPDDDEPDDEFYSVRATGYHHHGGHEYQQWHGTEWVTGHSRFRNGQWEYVRGHWRTR